MKWIIRRSRIISAGIFALLFSLAASGGQDAWQAATATTRPASTLPTTVPAGQRVEIEFSGGHETDGRDHGRPVALVAAALGVRDDVFRDAFSHVHPSREGPPSEEQARANKRELLSRLSQYGVTNDRLDEVSNYYRYRPQDGEMWKHRDAAAVAIVNEGKIVGFDITDAGAGYTTAPTVSVKGHPELKVTAKIAFTQDLATNGSIQSLGGETEKASDASK